MATYKTVMKSTDMVALVKHICFDLKTDYNNHYPYNLGYHHPDKWTWDCWNFYPKTLVWGWKETIPVGKYQPKNLSTGLGDWGGWTILNCCKQISTDFSKIKASEFLLLKDKSHAGCYVGEFTRNGKTYNVIECTAAWGRGVIPTYVDEQGNRREYKGGSKKNTPWGWHGLLPWLDYTIQPKDVVAVDGSWGMATTRYTQKMLGTTIDGIVSKQPRSNKKYLPAASTNSWQFKIAGATGSNMIKALQKLIGADPDGKFGKKSVIALQQFLKKEGLYSGEIDGSMGKGTVKAWQMYINKYFAK